MPKFSPETKDLSSNMPVDDLNTHVMLAYQSPMVVCGVSRKVNIGHFETVDIYCGVSLPVGEYNPSNFEELKQKLSELALEGFAFTSKETGERYSLIKESIKSGREAAPE